MDSGGMPPDWKPSPPPPVGSAAWKTDIAVRQVTEMMDGFPKSNRVFKCMRCAGHEIGYLCINYKSGAGWDYFRVDAIEDLYETANAPKAAHE